MRPYRWLRPDLWRYFVDHRPNPSLMHLRYVLALLVLLSFATDVDAQRGGRDDGSRRRPNSRGVGSPNNDYAGLPVRDRLWYGAGGTLNFVAYNGESFAQIGLTPMVGYRLNNWLSAGPRAGVIATIVKGPIDNGTNARFVLLDLVGGIFARAKVAQFYGQVELNGLSYQIPEGINTFGEYVTEPDSDSVRKTRIGDTQLLTGIGYNPGIGGVGTDIGLFYNLFDDVNSATNPFVFRIMLTFNY